MNNDLYNKLLSLRAHDLDHINGELITHLKGTYDLLHEWNVNKPLLIAGLFHAAYSTFGYSQHLTSDMNRNRIVSLIGQEAENIVYLYCACERDYFWPQIGVEHEPVFLNRFTQEKYYLSTSELQNFCELTVANELEIAMHNSEFVKKHYSEFSDLFSRMSQYISHPAINKIKTYFDINT